MKPCVINCLISICFLKIISSMVTPLVQEPELKKKDSAFDEIEEFNEEVDVEHDHPAGTHVAEGDMIEDDLNLPVNEQKRGTIRNDLQLWRTREIPYIISQEREDVTVQIENGMREISSKTCIRFVQKTTEPNYIIFTRKKGCWSYIGMRPGGQEVSIGNGCERREVVAHQILHALGFYHEQSRPDRDKFIKIIWRNIKPGKYNQFQEANPLAIGVNNLPYDLKSVMHYGNKAFGQGRITLISKQHPSLQLGNRRGLSQGDVDEIKRLYHCDELPIGGFGPWNDMLPCASNVRLKYRVCYGQSEKVCDGPGVQNGIQVVREICTEEPIEAYMEGCFNHKDNIINQMPLQLQPTRIACSGVYSGDSDKSVQVKKLTRAFIICAHFAKKKELKKFGITKSCRCHYGNDDIDITQNGRSGDCVSGTGNNESMYLYILD